MEEKLRKRRIAILGSTGSIGTQALDVIRQHRDLFEVELLTANNSSELLIRQAIEFDANAVVICNEDKYEEVSQALAPHYTKVFAGIQSVCDAVCGDNIDMVLTSMVGFSGLKPTVAAIKAGIFTGVMINKSNLFLHSLRFLIAFIISTPDGTHSQFFKSMTDNFSRCLRHIASSPVNG